MGSMQAKRADIAEIQKRIQESLPLWYPGVTGSNASLVFVHEKECRWSRRLLFRIIDAEGREGQGILVKCPKSQDATGRVQHGIRSAKNGALLEYKALSLLYDHWGQGQLDGVTAIRSLAYFADIDALVLEHVSGRDLLSMVLEAAKPWAKGSAVQIAVDAAGRAGKLAGALHQIKRNNYPRTEPFDGEMYYTNLRAEVDELLSLSIGKAVQMRLNNVLQTVRKFIASLQENVVVTYLHNDFYLDNFIVLPDGRVCIVDTTLEWTGPVEKDIGQLIVFAETSTQRLLGGAAAVRTRTMDSIIQAFITNYCGLARYSSRVLILYRLLALIQHWSRLLDVLQRKSPAFIMSVFQRARVEPFMLGHLDSVLNDLQNEFRNA